MASRLLSNQEIAMFEQLHQRILQLPFHAFGSQMESVIRRQFAGNPEAEMRYLNWSSNLSRMQRDKEREPASPQQFINTVQNLNYFRDQMPLLKLLEHPFQPFLPLGTAYGKAYILEPNEALLVPNRAPIKLGIQLFLHNILGVNTNVEVRPAPGTEQDRGGGRRRRNKNMSEESTSSGESDDNQHGFVFHQLGALAVFRGDWSKIKDYADAKRAPEYMWKDTGFVVVVECGSGLAGAIYILFNFTPPVEDDSGDVTRERIEEDEDWGYLPGFRPQFSVAKIADRFGDLRFGKEFAVEMKCRHECEIVNTIPSGSNTIIRQTVQLE